MKDSVKSNALKNARQRISFSASQRKAAVVAAAVALCGAVSLSVKAQESSGSTGEGTADGLSSGVPGQTGTGTSQGTTSSGSGSDAQIDVLSATLGHTITRDSNLFRRPDSANPRSDTLNSTALSLRFDKPVSQQHFHFDVTEVLNRYDNLSYLNFNATSYRGSWRWAPSQRWTVALSADRAKSLAPFEDTLGGSQRNIVTSENHALNVDGWVAGPWYVILGVGQSNRESEQGVEASPDERTKNASLGLRYLSALGNTITATRRESKGDYLNQSVIPGATGSEFRENETSLAAVWRLSEKSTVQGRFGRLERTENQVGQRDFSGPFVQLGYTWLATSALSFNVSAGRETSALLDPSFSYSQNDTVSFSPIWRLTDKVSTHMTLAQAKRKYRGEGPLPPVAPAREDKTNEVELGLDWLPVRNLTVTTSIQQQRRSSNQANAEYDVDIANVGVSWRFW